MISSLDPVRLAHLAARLVPYHALEVRADGGVCLVRSFKVKSIGDLEDACRHYRSGDTATIERRDEYWLLVFRRPFPQKLDQDPQMLDNEQEF